MPEETLPKDSTIDLVIAIAAQELRNSGVEDPSIVAEMLVCDILRCKRGSLRALGKTILGKSQRITLDSYIAKAREHEPLQYITGKTEFMGLALQVDRSVLIPRPETEILVEKVIELSKTLEDPVRALDIGTGSGNIAVAFAKLIHHIEVDAIDISADAIRVAEKNVKHYFLNTKVRLFAGDILGEIAGIQPPYGIIVSNPPYISTEEFAILPNNVKNFEPRIALCDEGDGLAFYRRLAEIGSSLLIKGGWIAVEIGYNQSQEVADIFEKSGYANISLTKDYGGIDRVLAARNGVAR